jgi:20S proteasome alpha/beta subunit
MCADMEEVGVGASKRKINKLFYRGVGGAHIVFAGAGSSAVIDNAIQRMDDEMRKVSLPDEDALRDLVDRTLLTVYQRYVWPNLHTDHRINLLAAYVGGLQQRLWITHDTVTAPEVRYVCAGIGEDLANYFADRLYHPHFSEQQMVRLAAFIFKEVKDNVSNVGQGTQMWMLRKNGQTLFYDHPEIALIENTLPPLDTSLRKYAEGIVGPTVFPLLPFQLDVPYVELCRKTETGGVITGTSIHNAKYIKKLTFE